MRKYLLGLIAGIIIASAVPAYGAVTSSIGMKVSGEKTVTLNSQEIGSAVIVDGKSYLPVRSVADALDLEIDVNKEAIDLMSEESTTGSTAYQIAFVEGQIEMVEGSKRITSAKRDKLKAALSQPNKMLESAKLYRDSLGSEDPRLQKAIDSVAMLEQQEAADRARLAELEAEIAEYDKQIAARQAELAELEGK